MAAYQPVVNHEAEAEYLLESENEFELDDLDLEKAQCICPKVVRKSR